MTTTNGSSPQTNLAPLGDGPFTMETETGLSAQLNKTDPSSTGLEPRQTTCCGSLIKIRRKGRNALKNCCAKNSSKTALTCTAPTEKTDSVEILTVGTKRPARLMEPDEKPEVNKLRKCGNFAIINAAPPAQVFGVADLADVPPGVGLSAATMYASQQVPLQGFGDVYGWISRPIETQPAAATLWEESRMDDDAPPGFTPGHNDTFWVTDEPMNNGSVNNQPAEQEEHFGLTSEIMQVVDKHLGLGNTGQAEDPSFTEEEDVTLRVLPPPPGFSEIPSPATPASPWVGPRYNGWDGLQAPIVPHRAPSDPGHYAASCIRLFAKGEIIRDFEVNPESDEFLPPPMFEPTDPRAMRLYPRQRRRAPSLEVLRFVDAEEEEDYQSELFCSAASWSDTSPMSPCRISDFDEDDTLIESVSGSCGEVCREESQEMFVEEKRWGADDSDWMMRSNGWEWGHYDSREAWGDAENIGNRVESVGWSENERFRGMPSCESQTTDALLEELDEAATFRRQPRNRRKRAIGKIERHGETTQPEPGPSQPELCPPGFCEGHIDTGDFVAANEQNDQRTEGKRTGTLRGHREERKTGTRAKVERQNGQQALLKMSNEGNGSDSDEKRRRRVQNGTCGDAARGRQKEGSPRGSENRETPGTEPPVRETAPPAATKARDKRRRNNSKEARADRPKEVGIDREKEPEKAKPCDAVRALVETTHRIVKASPKPEPKAPSANQAEQLPPPTALESDQEALVRALLETPEDDEELSPMDRCALDEQMIAEEQAMFLSMIVPMSPFPSEKPKKKEVSKPKVRRGPQPEQHYERAWREWRARSLAEEAAEQDSTPGLLFRALSYGARKLFSAITGVELEDERHPIEPMTEAPEDPEPEWMEEFRSSPGPQDLAISTAEARAIARSRGQKQEDGDQASNDEPLEAESRLSEDARPEARDLAQDHRRRSNKYGAVKESKSMPVDVRGDSEKRRASSERSEGVAGGGRKKSKRRSENSRSFERRRSVSFSLSLAHFAPTPPPLAETDTDWKGNPLTRLFERLFGFNSSREEVSADRSVHERPVQSQGFQSPGFQPQGFQTPEFRRLATDSPRRQSSLKKRKSAFYAEMNDSDFETVETDPKAQKKRKAKKNSAAKAQAELQTGSNGSGERDNDTRNTEETLRRRKKRVMAPKTRDETPPMNGTQRKRDMTPQSREEITERRSEMRSKAKEKARQMRETKMEADLARQETSRTSKTGQKREVTTPSRDGLDEGVESIGMLPEKQTHTQLGTSISEGSWLNNRSERRSERRSSRSSRAKKWILRSKTERLHRLASQLQLLSGDVPLHITPNWRGEGWPHLPANSKPENEEPTKGTEGKPSLVSRALSWLSGGVLQQQEPDAVDKEPVTTRRWVGTRDKEATDDWSETSVPDELEILNAPFMDKNSPTRRPRRGSLKSMGSRSTRASLTDESPGGLPKALTVKASVVSITDFSSFAGQTETASPDPTSRWTRWIWGG
eukprot:Gregarina_sp_Poly_1__5170@NODE_273_length_10223_cov_99_622391_g238_i0_p1_GENE_NODE_273_length_10223_cov_99_622391_g238_i0NODE_273_length_10223_cov_99_622391_g238_i0_p1_ORF_typecomplete_len1490_score241_16TTSSLRR/PF12468_8/1_3e04TTSSLRR/PF12468_8/0_2_NODE_273_length_10223_cov_99_622391_g238_i048149283